MLARFATLEDQLTAFTSDFGRSRAGYSPDRLDALVWALTDLMLQRHVKPPGFVEPVIVSRPRYIPGSDYRGGFPNVAATSPHRPSWCEEWYPFVDPW